MGLFEETPLPNKSMPAHLSGHVFLVSSEGLPSPVQMILSDKICYYILLCALFASLYLL